MLGHLLQFLHPTQSYAICSVARSGAHMLTEALQATRHAGRPMQYFNERLAIKYGMRYGLDPVSRFADYVRGVVRVASTPNAVFGFRIESWDLPRLVKRLAESGEFGSAEEKEIGLLQAAFPQLRFIELTREDKLRQAISKARAIQTNLWLVAADKQAIAEPRFDPDLITHCLQSAQREEQDWALFFQRNGIEPYRITYEKLDSHYSDAVCGILDFLRVRVPRDAIPPEPKTIRQSDCLNREWEERYLQLHPEFHRFG